MEECPLDVGKYRMKLLKKSDACFNSIPDKDRIESFYQDRVAALVGQLCQLAGHCAEMKFDIEEAMNYMDMAIKIFPNQWQLYSMSTAYLTKFLRYEEGVKYAEKALELNTNTTTLFNMGAMLDGLRKYDEAEGYYRKVIEKEPDNINAHHNLGHNLLVAGKYEEGWKEAEWRFKIDNPALKIFMNSLRMDVPAWDGSPLDGRRIFLYIEQGVGDQMQFLRYLPYVKGGYKILGCFRNVEKLFRNCKGFDELLVYDDGEFLPANFQYDVSASIMSLPYLLKMNDIPSGDQYIWPQPEDLFDLSEYKGLKIGIAWCGHSIHKRDHIRSCYLRYFKQLQLPGVTLFSLQKGEQERMWPNKGIVNLLEGSEGIELVDWSDRFHDFNATANLIQQLDLVVSIDTSIAHLTGCLGKPVWLLSSGKFPDWRWGLEGDTTPWYSSMKIFRGTWDEIFPEVARNLQQLV